MNILHAFDLFSPSGGGIVTVMREVTRALAARGHRVAIYASDLKLDEDFLSSMSRQVELKLFHCESNLYNFCYMPSIRKEARLRLKEFDIVHFQTYRSYQNLVLHKEAVARGVPYVLESHGTLPRTTGGKRSAVWLLKHLFDAATRMNILKDAGRVIAHSRGAVNEYREFGVPDEKIALILPPFDTGDFRDLPPENSFRQAYDIPDKKMVLALGRIHRIKGLDFLVESFARLAARRDDVVLVIAGNDDGYLDRLERMVADLKLADKVVFTGLIQGDAKLAALRDAGVLVQPSLYEYNSRVVYESVLCGTPVIVSSGTMSSENVANMDAGYLVDYGDHDRLVELMDRVLSDPGEGRRKAEKAAEYIRQNLSVDKVVGRYEELYREVIAARKSA